MYLFQPFPTFQISVIILSIILYKVSPSSGSLPVKKNRKGHRHIRLKKRVCKRKNSAILLKNLMWLCDVALTIISIGDKCQNDISVNDYIKNHS